MNNSQKNSENTQNHDHDYRIIQNYIMESIANTLIKYMIDFKKEEKNLLIFFLERKTILSISDYCFIYIQNSKSFINFLFL